jgi:hypothetical protein
LISSPFYYSITLVFSCLLLIGYLFVFGVLPSVLAIVFLLVYVGAMIIIVGYVCSVSPSIKSEYFFSSVTLSLVLLGFFFRALVTFVLVSSYFSVPSFPVSASEYMYSYSGVTLFFFLGFTLLLLLLLLSHIVSIKSTVRRG